MKLNILWQKEDKIALGLSAGVDSMVLLHLLVNNYQTSYKELVIFHINHGLRDESDEEEKFVISLAKKYQLKLHIARLHLRDKKRANHHSFEMQAREERYKAFSEFAKKEQLTKVLTAHHRDDHIENILIRLITGRSIGYDLGIEAVAHINKLAILRPMLEIKKLQITDYAKTNHIKFYQDKTNFDTDYTRNFVRHKIVPLLEDVNKGAYSNLENFAKHYKRLNDSMFTKAQEKIDDIHLKEDKGEISFDESIYQSLTTEEKYILLHSILKKYFVDVKVSRDSLLTAIASIDRAKSNIKLDLKANLKIIKAYQSITIYKFEKKCYNDKIQITAQDIIKESNYLFNDYPLEITGKNVLAEVGFNQADLPLTIGVKTAGDRIKRGEIHKKLSRLFIDLKIPKIEREKIPVVKNKDGKILGVLGIGLRVSQQANFDYYIRVLKG